MKPETKPDILRKVLWWALLVLIATFYIMLWNFSLPGMDDYMFKGVYLRYADNFDFDLSAFWKTICEIRQGDNGRIPNITGVMFSSMGIWPTIFPWITGLLMTAIIYMSARMASTHRIPGFTDMALVWTLITLFLPWRNYLIVPIYSLNYIYSTFLALLFLSLMLRWQRKGYPLSNLWWLLPLAFLTAGWHEGIAIPLAIGLFVQTLVARNRNPRWWCVGCFFALSILPFVLSPGLMSRSGQQMFTAFVDFHRVIFDYLLLEILTIVLIILYIVQRCRKKLIYLLKIPYLLILLVAAYSSVIFSLTTVHSSRMAFLAVICSVIWSIALYTTFTKHSRIWSRLTKAFSIIGIILCSIIYSTAIDWQHKVYLQRKAILATIENENVGTVFYDLLDCYNLPKYTLYIPTGREWGQPFTYIAMNEAWPDRHIAVIPTALKNARLIQATVLGSDSVIHRYKGNLIAPYSLYRNLELKDYHRMSPIFRIKWKSGRYDEYLGFVLPFKPGEKHDSLTYIYIYNADPVQIDSVNIIGIMGIDRKK